MATLQELMALGGKGILVRHTDCGSSDRATPVCRWQGNIWYVYHYGSGWMKHAAAENKWALVRGSNPLRLSFVWFLMFVEAFGRSWKRKRGVSIGWRSQGFVQFQAIVRNDVFSLRAFGFHFSYWSYPPTGGMIQ